jgi:hypothetical protein
MSPTDLEMAGLSDEERAALEDDETLEDRALLQDLLDDEGDDAEDPNPEAVATADDPDQELRAESVSEVIPTREFQAQYQAPAVPDYAERMAQLAQAQQELAKSYEDGDFDLPEYQTKLRDLSEAEWGLREAQLKATLAEEQRGQALAQRWQWEQEHFFAQGANRAYREDPMIGQAFSTAVQVLAADAGNDNKPMSWFLEEADRMTRQRFVVSAEQPSKAPRSTRTRPAVPPTLGHLPAAQAPETGGDEFGYLDKLSGMALERALSKLSQADEQRWLMGQAA